MRVSSVILAALAAVGVYVSELLVRVHIDTRYLQLGDSGICGSDPAFSCADVATSRFAELGGLPIASLGQAFYLAALAMVLLSLLWRSARAAFADVFFAGGLIAVLYSIFLFAVSKLSVGKLCPLCLMLYGVNLGLFVAAWLGHPDGGRAAFARVHRVVGLKQTWLTLGVLVVATIGTQSVYAHRARAASEEAAKRRAATEVRRFEVALGDSPGRGPADAAVVVVEFSDFECPYCKRLSESLKAVAEAEPGLVRYYFKHFPMDNACNATIQGPMHQDACRAATAMVCANRQGRGFELHDLMFKNQQALGREALKGYAAQVGIDAETFDACLDDPSALEEVKRDIAQGVELGVKGTPMWFANGWRQIGARDPEGLRAILLQARRDAEKEAAGGAAAPR
ncbi:MAG: thioredoxin domain-containing protein [Myxococcales bacterium]|nr:thioredoxin domain-containing protein [Myxococcales bacterium]